MNFQSVNYDRYVWEQYKVCHESTISEICQFVILAQSTMQKIIKSLAGIVN